MVPFWKVKNSHKIPQKVELQEFDIPEVINKYDGMFKGHRLILSREIGYPGCNLFATIITNGKKLANLQKIVISWSEWGKRLYNFNYFPKDDNVSISDDEIKIDLGSFNNCNSSINFLKRTIKSQLVKFDLLDYLPVDGDYEYEKDYKTQSMFCPSGSIKELKDFNKGVHYIDS